jgi:hypothetical protein
MDEAASEKVQTKTGMKVYGHRYGNAAKAHRDQTKHELDKMKGPKEKDLKEEGDCVTKPEVKDIAKKEVKGHEKKMHHAEEMTIAKKWKEKAKAKIKENKGCGPKETFTDNNMGEEVRKSDVPAYLRKAKGEKPLTVADVKGPKKDTISHPENLAKARNEWKEEVELTEHDEKFAKSHGFTWHPETYGATMSHPKHGHININRYGEWTHHKEKSAGGRGVGIAIAHGQDQQSLHHHLGGLHEAKVTTPDGNPDKITTDMIKGRVEGGKANDFKSFKLKLKSDGEMKSPDMEEPEETAATKSIKAKEPHVDLPNLKTESNDSHTHAAHYENDKGEWTGMNLLTAKDDDDAIKQAHEKCKEGCRLTKVERHIPVKEEKNWIAGAIKKPGAETAAAKRAGMSTQAYAEKHKHDSGKAGKRARLAITLSKMHKEELELDEQINEVLSKDADAGDWIHDFIHSDNPKFAGKSKAERKKMALGAYYAKQNEEKDDSGSWYKETPWKTTKGTVTDKSGAKHTPMSRAKDLARSALKKIKNETMMGKISN